MSDVMTPYADRLLRLRTELTRFGVDGLLVPRGDEFLGEYVPSAAERLAWLTGFTGSAGLALVLPRQAFLFVDGRYVTQAAAEVERSLWQHRHLIDQPPQEVLRTEAAGMRIGYDPWLHAEATLERLAAAGVELVPLPANPLDAIWRDRPALPTEPALIHPLPVAGEAAALKREAAAGPLRAAHDAAVVLADPHSVCWLLNIRGRDLPHTPLVLARAILYADATVDLFLDAARAGGALRDHLGDAVRLRQPAEFEAALGAFAGRRVRLDADVTPAAIPQRLRAAGAEVVRADDPCRLPRACKNAAEQDGARAAHRRDALALVRFLAWFDAEVPRGRESELSAAARLLAFRADLPGFVAESFPAISGAGEHGAVIHYRATLATNRAIGSETLYLIDSGAQYLDGTTDVTRTLWTGGGTPDAAMAEHYTRVLKGHLALGALRFPEGVAGPHLDVLARQPLWQLGLDYDHGTGHGVGSFLSVHEGPAGISRAARPVALRPGMILSNEPGYYLPGRYGIRIENLLMVQQAAALPGQTKPFLEFETLTLVPYDRRLIRLDLLTPEERQRIDQYHARVAAELEGDLPPDVAAWLRAACSPLG
jgi:Xaa-Pro aminopeptidase